MKRKGPESTIQGSYWGGGEFKSSIVELKFILF